MRMDFKYLCHLNVEKMVENADVFIKYVVAVAAYSRLASRSQAEW